MFQDDMIEKEIEKMKKNIDKKIVITLLNSKSNKTIEGKLINFRPCGFILIENEQELTTCLPFIGLVEGIREIRDINNQIIYHNPLLKYKKVFYGTGDEKDRLYIEKLRNSKFGINFENRYKVKTTFMS